MQYRAFLIKYAEIALKGKNRYLFENALVDQIRRALKNVEGDLRVRKEQGRIYVECHSDTYDYEECLQALGRVFGIVGICPVVILEDNGFEELTKDVLRYMEGAYPGCSLTFKVNARRARKAYPLQSMEINARLGEAILDAFPGMGVDVHHPQLLLNVEIREKIYVYSQEIPGLGGMPAGCNGKAMLHRQPGGRVHDLTPGCIHRGCLFPRAALYQRTRPAEGGGSGRAGVGLLRTGASACGKFYRHTALHLRPVSPR